MAQFRCCSRCTCRTDSVTVELLMVDLVWQAHTPVASTPPPPSTPSPPQHPAPPAAAAAEASAVSVCFKLFSLAMVGFAGYVGRAAPLSPGLGSDSGAHWRHNGAVSPQQCSGSRSQSTRQPGTRRTACSVPTGVQCPREPLHCSQSAAAAERLGSYTGHFTLACSRGRSCAFVACRRWLRHQLRHCPLFCAIVGRQSGANHGGVGATGDDCSVLAFGAFAMHQMAVDLDDKSVKHSCRSGSDCAGGDSADESGNGGDNSAALSGLRMAVSARRGTAWLRAPQSSQRVARVRFTLRITCVPHQPPPPPTAALGLRFSSLDCCGRCQSRCRTQLAEPHDCVDCAKRSRPRRSRRVNLKRPGHTGGQVTDGGGVERAHHAAVVLLSPDWHSVQKSSAPVTAVAGAQHIGDTSQWSPMRGLASRLCGTESVVAPPSETQCGSRGTDCAGGAVPSCLSDCAGTGAVRPVAGSAEETSGRCCCHGDGSVAMPTAVHQPDHTSSSLSSAACGSTDSVTHSEPTSAAVQVSAQLSLFSSNQLCKLIENGASLPPSAHVSPDKKRPNTNKRTGGRQKHLRRGPGSQTARGSAPNGSKQRGVVPIRTAAIADRMMRGLPSGSGGTRGSGGVTCAGNRPLMARLVARRRRQLHPPVCVPLTRSAQLLLARHLPDVSREMRLAAASAAASQHIKCDHRTAVELRRQQQQQVSSECCRPRATRSLSPPTRFLVSSKSHQTAVANHYYPADGSWQSQRQAPSARAAPPAPALATDCSFSQRPTTAPALSVGSVVSGVEDPEGGGDGEEGLTESLVERVASRLIQRLLTLHGGETGLSSVPGVPRVFDPQSRSTQYEPVVSVSGQSRSSEVSTRQYSKRSINRSMGGQSSIEYQCRGDRELLSSTVSSFGAQYSGGVSDSLSYGSVSVEETVMGDKLRRGGSGSRKATSAVSSSGSGSSHSGAPCRSGGKRSQSNGVATGKHQRRGSNRHYNRASMVTNSQTNIGTVHSSGSSCGVKITTHGGRSSRKYVRTKESSLAQDCRSAVSADSGTVSLKSVGSLDHVESLTMDPQPNSAAAAASAVAAVVEELGGAVDVDDRSSCVSLSAHDETSVASRQSDDTFESDSGESTDRTASRSTEGSSTTSGPAVERASHSTADELSDRIERQLQLAEAAAQAQRQSAVWQSRTAGATWPKPGDRQQSPDLAESLHTDSVSSYIPSMVE